MFDPKNYEYNAHAVPVYVVGLSILIGGIFARLKNRRSLLTLPFLFICISVSVWLIATATGYLSKDEMLAAKWFKIDNFGVMFISVSILFFTEAVLQSNRYKSVIAGYVAAFILGITAVSTDWLVVGANKHSWGFFPAWGPLSIPVFILFFGYMSASFTILFRKYKTGNLTAVRKNQIKYLIVGSLIGYTASVDFLPTLNIEIYPFGYISIMVFLIIIAYTAIRYRLMDLKVAITRAGIFAIVYGIVLGIPFGVGAMLKPYLINVMPNWWLLPMALLAIMASAGPFIYLQIQKRVEERLRTEEFKSHKQLRRLSQNMLRVIKLEGLLKLMVHYLVKILKLKFAAVYLIDDVTGNYRLRAFWQLGDYVTLPAEFTKDFSLAKELNLKRLPVVTEELKLFALGVSSSRQKELASTLSVLKVSAAIPAFLRSGLFGFIVLSDKRADTAFTQEELNLLMVLSNEAALAIENAQFHQKDRAVLIEKSRREALADMAPGASHQFNNRLVAISSSAELLLSKLEDLDTKGIKEDSLKDFLRDAKNTLELIDKEVYKGKEITSAILKRAKARVDFQKVDIPVIIENTYKLVLISHSRPGGEKFREPKFTVIKSKDIPQVIASEALLQDSFYNLLDNACDAIQEKARLISSRDIYTKDSLNYHGAIEVTLEQENSSLVMRIKDNGIGLKKEGQRKIFTPYFTTKASSGKGTGLGLYVIRDFIEMHKGTITCESEYKVGTTFTVKIPMQDKEKG
ncbi:MAG: GAF domain-containing protein [Candidatus Omnitrophica bacterium]|nr:GAF domain-containing protein [Candidatus Omnitrophota bacterium]